MDTLPALLVARSAQRGASTVLRRKDLGIWKAVSWRELHERVQAVGAALLADGVGPGAMVGVLSETRPEWAYADLAIMGAGAVSVGLSAAEPAEQLAAALAACACKLVFVENEEQLDKVLTVRGSCPALTRVVVFDMTGLRDLDPATAEGLDVFLARGVANAAAWDASAAALQPDSPAAAIFTAGTTGPAKAALLTHRALAAQAASGAAMLGQVENDERLAFLPMSHVLERVAGLYQSLSCGAVTNYVESPETVPDNLQEVQPTVIGAVPQVWERLRTRVQVAAAEASPLQRLVFDWALRVGHRWAESRRPAWLGLQRLLAEALVLRPVRRRLGLARARVAFSAMAAMPPGLLCWYRALGVDMREAYAVTECAGLVNLVSQAVPDTADVRMSPTGELLVRGTQLSTGYAGSPVLALRNGWLHTGDLGVEAPGGWSVLGRLENDGAPPAGVIETALRDSPFIADAVVGQDGGELACIIAPDADMVERWARIKGVGFQSLAGLLRSEPVRELLRAEVAAVNAGLAPSQRLRSMHVIERRLQPGDPDMTPAMTMRRTALRDRATVASEKIQVAA